MTATAGDPNQDREAERLRETYRGYAASGHKRRIWSATNRGNIAIREELLAAILELAEEPLRGGGEILDVGCGSGWLLAELASRGVGPERLHGVDLIPERVAAASGRLPGADLQHADARKLPHENGRFRLVFMITTLSSMTSAGAAAALLEVARVTAPDGLTVCYEPRRGNPLNGATRRVSRRELRTALGPELETRTLTGFPPFARLLGRMTQPAYPHLSRLLPTHRLSAYRAIPD
jgi:SAM-dependent methyltransferase